MVQNKNVTYSHEPIVRLENISRSFGQKEVLKHISFDIPRNSIYSIVGSNGAGKTTLLRIISGMLTYNGNVKFTPNNEALSFQLENDYFYESLSGYENLYTFATYFKVNKDECDRFCQQYAEILDLSDRLSDKVSDYSKGMKRKLSLLVTLLKNTEFIMLDEPTSGVDPQSRIQIRDLFTALKHNGKTILITSHDLSELEKISDYISIISSGTIVKTIDNKLRTTDLEREFMQYV